MTLCSPVFRLAVCAALSVGPAFAQSQPVPEKIAPGAKPSGPTQNLSRQLNQSGGVIAPGGDPDPGIEKPAPSTGDGNAIPPPGAPGGKPAPQAK